MTGARPGAEALVLAVAAPAACWAALRLADSGMAPAAGWALVIAGWLLSWRLVDRLGRLELSGGRDRLRRLAAPAVFGLSLLFLWEAVTTGAQVPQVLLPAPSMIGARMAASTDVLWADFVQTFVRAVLAGWAMGCGAAVLMALAVDRSPFLQRGLMPVAGFLAALPIIGVAPIMVMWFGFDWHSKAAVVICMVFFPMLVNTVAGLQAAERMQRDLMRTYAASHRQEMLKLRLPAAAPFVFNGLKITSTLALIGAIVAEFFGTPTVGMGFRISTEVGRLNLDMVWAEIAVAALAGSTFYGLLAALERQATFWHPSQR